MGTMKKGILVLDPRTKILLLLGINIYVFTNSYVWAEIIVMAALIILLLLCGVYKAALKSAVTYSSTCNQILFAAILPGNYINFAEYCCHYFPQVASLRNISNFARSDDTYSVAYARIAKVAFTSDCNYTVSNHSTLLPYFA